MSRPIFILSLPRAGSTLLQRLLLASGRCATFGEPSLLLRFLGGDDVLARRATYWESLVETSVDDIRKEWPGFDESYRDGVRKLMLPIYDGLAGGKEWFVDKTPRYSLIAEEIFQTFPEAKFIILWRHPLAVAASMSSTFRKGRWCPDEFGIDLYAGMERLWQFRERHPESVCEVKYEDLVDDPGPVLKRLGDYLGWDELEKVLADDLAKSVGGTLGDPTGVHKYSRVSASSRDAWQGQMSNWYRRKWARDYYSASKKEWVRGLGYDLPELSGPVRICSGLRDWLHARHRVARRLVRPTWLPRYSRKFLKSHGYGVSFR